MKINKPCPKCNSNHINISAMPAYESLAFRNEKGLLEIEPVAYVYHVECKSCGIKTKNYESIQEAIGDWNTRQ